MKRNPIPRLGRIVTTAPEAESYGFDSRAKLPMLVFPVFSDPRCIKVAGIQGRHIPHVLSESSDHAHDAGLR